MSCSVITVSAPFLNAPSTTCVHSGARRVDGKRRFLDPLGATPATSLEPLRRESKALVGCD